MNFDNSYATLPGEFHATVQPDKVAAPSMLAWNQELAADLGLGELSCDTDKLARAFSGVDPIPGSQPISLAYAGHQFGNFVPLLGDGRAVLLGELVSHSGKRFDIQLKGSGRTPFSRGGDGKSWLGPVLREYLLSEAMYHLGIPTSRALAAVASGEPVFREESKPGAVFTRVASSHLRVGTFQYFAARNDIESLKTLTDYAISRHYPDAQSAQSPYIEFFRNVAQKQAQLIAHWMSVGFIHGVMNTDNTSISGETIDYGPAAYMDEFRINKVFSFIDQQGRYAYANQPAIGQWNLARLAETLLVLGVPRGELETALSQYPAWYEQAYLDLMRPKMGLLSPEDDDAQLVEAFLEYLQDHELDYTLSFRSLSRRIDAQDEPRFGDVETHWQKRISSQKTDAEELATTMNSVNPLFIPRNHRVEQAIQQAVEGDLSVFQDLDTVLAKPFEEQTGLMHYAEAPTPDERVARTFCGT